MPAVSTAQQRLFRSALQYKLQGGEVPQRVKNLSNLPEATLRDFTVLAPGVKGSRALFPQYSGKGPTLSKSLKDVLREHVGERKYTADMRWRALPSDNVDSSDLIDLLEQKHQVKLPDDKLGKTKTLGHLQHLLNNSMTTTLKKAAAYLSSIL